jgi:RNA polymerase-binding transcription factor DksA
VLFEPPRFFDALLRGRHAREAPDITARICGICPVAYQMSAVHALERLFGVSIDPAVRATMRVAIERERDAARLRITELNRSLDDIDGSVDAANTDDEHDPEGATVAYERAQVVSLLQEAQRRLDALADAAGRIDAGAYGVCERAPRVRATG